MVKYFHYFNISYLYIYDCFYFAFLRLCVRVFIHSFLSFVIFSFHLFDYNIFKITLFIAMNDILIVKIPVQITTKV